MIEICISGVVLFFTLFFYMVVKFQHVENVHHQNWMTDKGETSVHL
jgi:hypothetical protein